MKRIPCFKTTADDLHEDELGRLNQTTKSRISQPRAQRWREKEDALAAWVGLIRGLPGGGELKPVI